MSQYSLSVLCHFVALAYCIRSGYVGGQLVIPRNILSFFFSLLFSKHGHKDAFKGLVFVLGASHLKNQLPQRSNWHYPRCCCTASPAAQQCLARSWQRKKVLSHKKQLTAAAAPLNMLCEEDASPSVEVYTVLHSA